MTGKKNIVFGFLYLVLTAALGPVIVVNYVGDEGAAGAAKQEAVGAVQEAKNSGYLNSQTLESMTAEDIAKQNSEAILALSRVHNARAPIDAIKGGPHAHGNLEAVLNILAGFLLCFLALPKLFKQALSWIFILGALFHSGLLYLAVGLQLPWAGGLLGSPVAFIGPVLILLGLFLAGIGAAIGFRGRLVTDD
jgi:hypothetical protein